MKIKNKSKIIWQEIKYKLRIIKLNWREINKEWKISFISFIIFSMLLSIGLLMITFTKNGFNSIFLIGIKNFFLLKNEEQSIINIKAGLIIILTSIFFLLNTLIFKELNKRTEINHIKKLETREGI